MKISFASVAKSALALVTTEVDKDRKNGVFVSRPVLNSKVWHDWAVRHGVPNPVPAEKLQVTVVSSSVNILMVPDVQPVSVETGGGYYPGQFCGFGPAENVLVFAFEDWELQDRHWAWIRNGAVSKWPNYRPHMTISEDMGGFELSDAALQDAPRHIILGGEVLADRKPDEAEAPDDADPEGEGEDADIIIVIDIQRSAAKKLLETDKALSLMDRIALRDIVVGDSVTKSLADRMAKSPWASDELKAAFSAATTKKSREVVVQVSGIPVDVTKKLNGSYVRKLNDEERMVIGIANATTVGGEPVVDSDGDTFTTKALIEWTRDAIRNQRGVDFDHEGEPHMELVQAFVLSEDIQKALGFDIGFEPCLVEVHVADDEAWSNVKKGNWMFSIAGKFSYEDG